MDQCGRKFGIASSFCDVCGSLGDWDSLFESVGSLIYGITLEVNLATSCDYLDPALAWCGVKDSGRGVSLSKFGWSLRLFFDDYQ